MKQKLIVANWKMNKNKQETKKFFEELLPKIKNTKNEVVVAPSFTLLETASLKIKNANIKLGAQNMSYENKGAFTGEVNANMLKDFNVNFVILGHSERRQIFNESDETINKKILKAFENNLIPILCVGETKEEYEKNLSQNVVEKQVLNAIKNVNENDLNNLVIAYKPIWAIGTGIAITAKKADKMAEFIKKIIKNNVKNAKNLKILYGGSVNVNNFKKFFNEQNIDGALIGSASLEVDSFAKIILG